MVLAATTDLSEGVARERAVFLELTQGSQARALRHLIRAERDAWAPKDVVARSSTIEHIAVVGGGTRGTRIASAVLDAGLQVTLLETDADAMRRAQENMRWGIEAKVGHGLISVSEGEQQWARFGVSSDYGSAARATLAIEAVPERIEVKRTIFAALQANLSKDAVLATSSSCFDVDDIAADLDDPSGVMGIHFFGVPHGVQLLEIVQGNATSYRTAATGFALARRLQKPAVRAGFCDGLIGNRLLARYYEAADTVLLEGSTPWEVDEAMVEFGYAMGPYEAQDLTGLDFAYENRRRQDATRDPKRRYILIADRMIELGKLGKKAGAGWYRYPGGGGKVEDPIVADLAIEEAHFAKVTRRDFSAEEICERLLYAMINEAVGILDEGIASSARDIDLVTAIGCGFPRWRGGLLFYADTVGLRRVLAALERYAEEDDLVWTPNAKLQECADRGITLSEMFPNF